MSSCESTQGRTRLYIPGHVHTKVRNLGSVRVVDSSVFKIVAVPKTVRRDSPDTRRIYKKKLRRSWINLKDRFRLTFRIGAGKAEEEVVD